MFDNPRSSIKTIVYSLCLSISAVACIVGQSVAPSPNELYPVCEKSKCGYINRTGKVVIPLRFDDARDFSEGLAPVMVDKQQLLPNLTVGKWGYIDQTGNWTIKPTFDFAESFSEGLGNIWLEGKHGYVDLTGKMVIEPQFWSSNPFSDGVAWVIKDHQNIVHAFIDKSGKELLRSPVRGLETFPRDKRKSGSRRGKSLGT